MTARAAVSFDEIRRMAAAAGARYPELVAAQWQLESGGGKYLSGTNNPFGIKDPGGTVKTTQEVVNGKTVTTKAGFKNFGSTEEAVQHLVDRWYKDYKGYKGVNNAQDLAGAARMLKEQGYATDPAYTGKLLRIAGGAGGSSPALRGGPAASASVASVSAPSGFTLPAALEQAPAAGPATDPVTRTAIAALTGEVPAGAAAALAGSADSGVRRFAMGLMDQDPIAAALIGAAATRSMGQGAADLGADLAQATAAVAPSAAATAAAQGGQKLRTAGGTIGIIDLGKQLQKLGFKVAENEAFGRVGGHSQGSLHYQKNKHGVGSALDLTIQPGSALLKGLPDSDWRRVKREWGAKLAAALPNAQVLHPGNEPKGHSSHIHLGIKGGDFPLTPQLAALLQLQQG